MSLLAKNRLTADGEYFVGLALDDVNQFEETDSRIESWCEQVLTEVAALW